MGKGILYLVPTPIGNLGDMTYRGVETLKTVDLIAAEDTRTSQILLNHYAIKNKTISYHKFNESKQTKALIELLTAGKNIAVITDAGTPAISDPASIIVKAAIQQGIRVCCLPGASACITALAASGLDTESFVFVGFLPSKQKDRKELLAALKNSSHTLVLYESTHKLTKTLPELSNVLGDRICVIAKELSKIHETYYRGSLSEILQLPEFNLKGEFVILIEGRKEVYITDDELIDMIKKALEQKTPLRKLAEQISTITGINKNRIYEMALTIKEKS